MHSDRFILSANHMNRCINSFPSLKDINSNFDNDPQIAKLYRMLVMNDESIANIENQMQYNSLKCI